MNSQRQFKVPSLFSLALRLLTTRELVTCELAYDMIHTLHTYDTSSYELARVNHQR